MGDYMKKRCGVLLDMGNLSPTKRMKLVSPEDSSSSSFFSSSSSDSLTSPPSRIHHKLIIDDLNNKVQPDFIPKAFRKEATPLNEEELKSSKAATVKTPLTCQIEKASTAAAAVMPSEAELEDFFRAAEKYEEKRFTEKYNYDIVKDVPLEEGRYEWLKLRVSNGSDAMK